MFDCPSVFFQTEVVCVINFISYLLKFIEFIRIYGMRSSGVYSPLQRGDRL